MNSHKKSRHNKNYTKNKKNIKKIGKYLSKKNKINYLKGGASRDPSTFPFPPQPTQPGLSFIAHGEKINQSFIVPDGYKIKYFAKSGEPLSVIDQIKNYYQYSIDETYTHSYEEGEIISDSKLLMTPLMGKSKLIKYIGVLPSVYGFYKPRDIPQFISDMNTKQPMPIFNDLLNLKIVSGDEEKYKKYYKVFTILLQDYADKFGESDNSINNSIRKINTEISSKVMKPIESIKTTDNLDKTKPDVVQSFLNEYSTYSENINENIKKNCDLLVKEKLKPNTRYGNFLDLLIIKKNYNEQYNTSNVSSILNMLKPGEYKFYNCRILNEEFTQDINNGHQDSMSRALSIESPITKSVFKHKTREHLKYFGGINSKICVITRFNHLFLRVADSIIKSKLHDNDHLKKLLTFFKIGARIYKFNNPTKATKNIFIGIKQIVSSYSTANINFDINGIKINLYTPSEDFLEKECSKINTKFITNELGLVENAQPDNASSISIVNKIIRFQTDYIEVFNNLFIVIAEIVKTLREILTKLPDTDEDNIKLINLIKKFDELLIIPETGIDTFEDLLNKIKISDLEYSKTHKN
jgi:hypothetical protein